jgi:hypothetical protein
LENGYNNKDEAPGDYKGDGSPQQTLYRLGWKHADVEEDECELQERDLGEVQGRHDVEELQHLGNLLGAQRPDVLAKTMLDCAVYCYDGTWCCSKECGQHSPVVQADFKLGVDNLECKADDHESSRYANHDVGYDNIFLPAVARLNPAIG